VKDKLGQYSTLVIHPAYTGRQPSPQHPKPHQAALPAALSALPPGVHLDSFTRGLLSRVRRADDKLRIPGASQLGSF